MRLRLPIALAAALAAVGCTARGPTEPIWIGHLAPLSGTDAAQGAHARQGVELALALLPEDERRAGGRPVAVLHVDDRGDAETLRAETVRVLAVNHAAALLGGPPAALADQLTREAAPYGVPVLLPTEAPPTSRGDAVYSLAVSPAARGKALARYLSGDAHAERVLVVREDGDAVAGAAAGAFAQELRRAGRPPLEEWDARDQPEAKALERLRPSAALLACPPAEFARWRARLREAGFQGPLLYAGADAAPAELRPGAEELILATAYSAGGLSERGKDFARRYEERFGEAPDLHAAQAFDGTRLLVEALRQAGGPDAGRVREALDRVEGFEGVTGPLALKEHAARRRFFLVAVRDGKAHLLRTLGPDGE